ncbi:hypothetical protein AAFF_G00313400 [Aldrovandia affinis]|uniref:Uncharacterized protein n=1 Tax=Aldrovandia affinis TaxID=143900 RepID=A0AAD7SPF5_9TELE|nr:hypothetical protein AAFF_G00313400 [Aldrovandia affinis]
MEFKALHLLVTAPLLSSYLFVSVSCVTPQCSSSTDCISCIENPSCTWTQCMNESGPSCYNSSLKNEKYQNCTNSACQDLSSAVQSKIKEVTTATSAGKETSRTETSPVTPAIVTVPTIATPKASQTTAASHVTIPTAPVTTPKSTMTTSTTQPPFPTAGASNSTSETHTASTFDTGSFVGGMVLALSLTVILYLGYKFSCSGQEIRYRTIEEHDAII